MSPEREAKKKTRGAPSSKERKPRKERATATARERAETDGRDVEPSHAPSSEGDMNRPTLSRRPVARRISALQAADPKAPVEKGSDVRVLGGAFEGKTGVVQELDGRGGARVVFGLLAARVEVKDLVVLSRAKNNKPMIGSSHRKPQPPT